MKKIFAASAVCASLCSCIKEQTGPQAIGNLYESWRVVTIEAKQSGPGMAATDTLYNGGVDDSIKFSSAGDIQFLIKGWEHEDAYDAKQYNLLKDTAIIPFGADITFKVYLKTISPSEFYLIEDITHVDERWQKIYHVQK